jgi:hypothetical protein
MRVTKPSVKSMEFTREQMLEWFNKVQDDKHWKNPINKVITKPSSEELACLREAVVYYTGSMITVTEMKGNKIRVEADGYYLTIGA